MTKKALVKAIVEMEYTAEQRQDTGLVRLRTNDLMRHRKDFLEKRLVYLSK
jgi:hypothetical protein